ncbi:hypothetical protein ACQ4PT_007899 [Festuca glaucescens]
MSRPHAPPCPSAAQPNAAVAAPVYNARINAAGPTPRHPIPIPFYGRFGPLAVPPPAQYPAPFYQMRRPPVFPPAPFPGPHVYLPRPPPPGGFIPHPGPPFNPYGTFSYCNLNYSDSSDSVLVDFRIGCNFFIMITRLPLADCFSVTVLVVPGHTSLHESEPHVCFRRSNDCTRRLKEFSVFLSTVHPRYITQYPVYQQPIGFPPRPIYPPIGVLSHQRPVVIDGTSGPVAVARPPIAFTPAAPADEPHFIVFVGKIASTVDSDFVLSLLQVCGVVKSWNPVTNPIDGTSTAFGFCEFESAEGSLRARRLLNKLNIDGQELVLNVNEATKAYLQKFGDNTTEQNVGEAETETKDGMDAMQEIRFMIEDRMKSKFPCLPTPPAQPSASIIDEKGGNDTRSSALEERKIRRLCEKEDHLRESRAVGLQVREDGEVSEDGESSLQIREDGEVSEDGESSLQIDADSSMHIPMDCEPTVDNKRKRQHMESDGFHKSSDEETGIVSVPGLVSDKQNSGAPGQKVGLQLQALSKSGNGETLDAKQLLAAVPKTKEELFAYDVDWAIYDKHGLHEKMRPWISEKTTEIFGEEIPEFVEYVVASTKEHVEAPRMLEALASLMDHSAEKFVLWVWTKLIFEIKTAETGS